MPADTDVQEFVEAVGATEPAPGSPNYEKWKLLFRRSNYFLLSGKFTVVKISRSKKPFWGVSKEILDLFDNLDDYFLVLLVSSREGWAFSKSDVRKQISSQRWKLREADGNYKINSPLPDANAFYSPERFSTKFLGAHHDAAT